MALGEFDLIERWLRRPQDLHRARVVLGGGDDCALLQTQAGEQWAVSTDTLVEGRHFLSTVDPAALGHKALAVNLSDLAACGAQPQACTLNLTLPGVDEVWLEGFTRGFYALADAHGIVLAGGDTTAVPLNIAVTAMGTVPPGQALLRGGARAGDDLWVSHPAQGGLGDARLALEAFRGRVELTQAQWASCRARMERPEPRVALGLALRGLATAAIDLSDGLLGDLGHVLKASRLGAQLWWCDLPRSAALAAQSLAQQEACLLAGGDDYELLFTAPPPAQEAVQQAAALSGVAVRRIGRLVDGRGVEVWDSPADLIGGRPWARERLPGGFDHFLQA